MKAKRDISDLFKDGEAAWDEQPRPELWEQLDARLEADQGKKRVRLYKQVSIAASIMAFLFSLTIWGLLADKEGDKGNGKAASSWFAQRNPGLMADSLKESHYVLADSTSLMITERSLSTSPTDSLTTKGIGPGGDSLHPNGNANPHLAGNGIPIHADFAAGDSSTPFGNQIAIDQNQFENSYPQVDSVRQPQDQAPINNWNLPNPNKNGWANQQIWSPDFNLREPGSIFNGSFQSEYEKQKERQDFQRGFLADSSTIAIADSAQAGDQFRTQDYSNDGLAMQRGNQDSLQILGGDTILRQLRAASNVMGYYPRNQIQQGSQEKTKIEQFNWLLGNWEGAGQKGRGFEEWKQTGPLTITGRGYFVVNADTVITDKMEIRQIGEQVFYVTVIDSGSKPVHYRLKSLGPEMAVFENLAVAFPRQVIVERNGQNGFQTTLQNQPAMNIMKRSQNEYFQQRNAINRRGQVKRSMNRSLNYRSNSTY